MPPSAQGQDPTLLVETPERVQFSLDAAGLGTRALAYLVDFFILFLSWATLAFAASLLSSRGLSLDDYRALRSTVQALLVLPVET